MNLSERFMKIINFVRVNTSILDLGTDHGYIPIYLIENKISSKVIASDISKKSLNKTVELVKKKNLEDSIDVRLGDGLNVINPNEVQGLIIAGMGGVLIRDILEERKDITETIDFFIFQPMIASEELRRYLSENNFKIKDEELAKEGDKFYEIMYVVRGKDVIEEEINLDIGRRLIEKNHPLLKEFIENKIRKSKGIMKSLKNKKSSRSRKRYDELDNLVKEYMEVLRKIES